MKKYTALALTLAFLFPTLALAQEPAGIPRPSPKDPDPFAASTLLADAGLLAPAGTPLPRDLAEPLPDPALSARGAEFNLMQEEFAPNLRFGMTISARVDVPGDTSVDSIDNIAYSDIFDVGYGVAVEANLLSWLTPHWAVGGYVAVGWDRFTGASNVDMGTGEFFSFNDQDVLTVIVGGKILQKIAPFWFWEGRMGIGLVHYGDLTFSDV
ncbi:MAG TPA: hypothetical protein VKU80_15380, partial [Planctomycetota bacterium]|nr:hypothetical protein [Planctomycetota bacterium]